MKQNYGTKITYLNDYKDKLTTNKKVKSKNIKKVVKNNKVKKGQVDFMLLFLILLLVMFGVVMVFSASYYHSIDHYSDRFYFLKKQGMWAIISTISMFIVMNINYKFWKKIAPLAYIGSISLVAIVLIIGVSAKGATRWLKFGVLGFQPSEFAKIGLIIFLSSLMGRGLKKISNNKNVFKYMMLILVPTILVGIENWSTALVIFGVGCVLVYISSLDLKVMYFILMVVVVVYVGLYFIVPHMELTKYVPDKYKSRIHRVEVWLNPWSDPKDDGFQTIQSLYAVGSGGIFGLGIGKSRQKLGYIPEAHNDIIFSIVCEELGLIGAFLVIFTFMMLIYKGIKIAINAPDAFACLVATGITSLVAIQVIINIAVITNVIPVTGMSLPFISYGGSSLLSLMSAMGILLNISKYQKRV